MGLIDKIKNNFEYYKVDKFTKRRLSQTQFESHDRQYYEQVYRNGDYLDPEDARMNSPNRNQLQYKQSRWPSIFRKSQHKKPIQYTGTSEAYTYGYTRE